METQKICLWCQESFTAKHGNESYCCEQHILDAKADRQKRKRDPIARFLPIMTKNHELLEHIISEGIFECSADQLQAYGVDISICRFMKSAEQYPEHVVLDFGEYLLLTDHLFQNFKIVVNDTQPTL